MIADALSSNKGLKLRAFHAGRDRLENKGISALAKVFEKMQTLREIEVPQNGIKDEGMANLLEGLMGCVENLHTIRVNDNYLKASATEKLVELIMKSTKLKELDISDLNMGEMNVVAALRALHYHHRHRAELYRFACNFNEIENKKIAIECLDTLHLIHSLEHIDFIGNVESKKMQKEYLKKFEGKTIRFVEEEESDDDTEEEEEEDEEEVDYSKLDALFEKYPMLKKKPAPFDPTAAA